jgi:hypothetical protein
MNDIASLQRHKYWHTNLIDITGRATGLVIWKFRQKLTGFRQCRSITFPDHPSGGLKIEHPQTGRPYQLQATSLSY